MKATGFIIVVLVVCCLSFGGPAVAAESDWYLNDPTVAGRDGFLFGIGLQGWYVYGQKDVSDNQGVITQDESFGAMYGLRLVLAKGDFTLLANIRESRLEYQYVTAGGGTLTPYTLDEEGAEIELMGRYLLTGHDSNNTWVPYLLFGMTQIRDEFTITIHRAGVVFNSTGTDRLNQEMTILAPMVGGGAIIPFGETWGLRADAAVYLCFGEMERQGVVNNSWTKKSGQGLGYSANAALYYNITDHIGVDLGLNFMWLNGGSGVGDYSRAGIYTAFMVTF